MVSTATDPGTLTSTILYGYTNTAWGDQLTSYDGQTIVYDAMGNPTSYRGKSLTWRGKQLTGVSDTAHNLSAAYTYDSNGLRQQKTVNNVDTDYYYNGSVLIGLTKGTDTPCFSYDASGQVQAVDFNGVYYYYLRNGQGDIVKIIDSSGATKVEYTYDSWGKPLSCTGTLATTLGALNPFRCRGYVYDEETGFYYLKSRYYDPDICRFVSADLMLSTGQGVLGHNCYAYCLNNPVDMTDDGGCSADGNNTYVTADGDSGRMQKRIAYRYWFSEGEEEEALEAFRMGRVVYYKGVELVPIPDELKSKFKSSCSYFGKIHIFDINKFDAIDLRHEYI